MSSFGPDTGDETPQTTDAYAETVRPAVRQLLVLGPPIAAGVVLSFHTTGVGSGGYYSQILPVIDRWLALHLLFFPVLVFLGLTLWLLLSGYQGAVPTVGRIAIGVFVTCYLALESIAGIAVGVVIKNAESLPSAQQEGVAAVVETLFTDPLIGGGTFSVVVVSALLGYVVAVMVIAFVLRRAGAPRTPLVFVIGSSLGIVSHGFPTGVVGMGLLFTGVAWLELRWHPTGPLIVT